MVDVSKDFHREHVPTYKRSDYQLYKLYLSPALREMGCQFYITEFDSIFLSDHCALVLDVPLTIPGLQGERPKSRILSSLNAKKRRILLERV